MSHHLKKLRSTICILLTLGMARTFGRYDVSVYADGVSYARYHWRGKLWAFPTKEIEL